MEREVKVRGLILDPANNSPVVILKDVASEAMLPIWIGVFEANAIAMEIEKAVPQRPMTHDLLKNVIAQLGASVERVVITDLIDSTFYAIIVLDVSGEKIIVDSRPSDAIALALRTDSPIFVAEHVLRSSRSVISSREVEEEEWPEDLGDESSGRSY
ncbi:MAG: bifunctional nuclease family protein [Blastocatellia bacterium]|nr:bifunctional nuclease family protein [Blastocatellia bacterium]MCS7158027.1 bifunctional nuclease family protein [Blastocatellia bacterium]MCX7752534.1 bifunctional nuclease family protein [Blastocatellia bacterium]MDW8167351.1 bifunctional nuclease family protein [Acidobacteriota bacterium]MDW8257324.1 bifunctional nuclease family protein [Acidobacteriota bacterium]